MSWSSFKWRAKTVLSAGLLVFCLAHSPALQAAPGRTSDCKSDYEKLVETLRNGNARARRGMHFPEAELARHESLAKEHLAGQKAELEKKYQWKGFADELEPRLARRVTEELRRQQRFLPEFGARERDEMMNKLTFEVSEDLNREHQLREADARQQAVYEKIDSQRADWNDIQAKLDGGDFSKLTRDVLHDMLKGRLFKDLPAAERKALVDAAYKETLERFRAVDKEVEDRLVLLGGTSKLSAPQLKRLVMQELQMALRKRGKSSINELTKTERDALLDEMDSEIFSRLAWMNDAFQGMASRLGTPWRQWVRMHENEMKGAILEALGDELLAREQNFRDLSASKRNALIDQVASQVLSPYQSRPTLAVLAGGLGLPIAVGMIGGSFLPAKLAAGYAVLTGSITGPVAAYWNYWLGGATKPLVSPKSITTWRTADGTAGHGPTPLQREFNRLAATATGLTDQFKDGRNITKDSLIPLLDGLNDAAFHAQSQSTAEWMVAASILKHATSFPEVQLNTMDAFTTYMKLKDRFANKAAMDSIRAKIQDLASRWGEQPTQALETLQRVLNPNNWAEFPPEPLISEGADRDLHRVLTRGKSLGVDEQTRHVALGALLMESRYAGSSLNPLTVAEFHTDYATWLANAANYEKAKQEITKHAVNFNVKPEAAIARLDRLCRKGPDDNKPDPILQLMRPEATP